MKKATENLKTHFEEKISNTLDQQADSLDDSIVQRLQEARQTALSKQKISIRSPRLNLTWITGAGAGLALASVLGFMVIPHLTANLADNEESDPSLVFMDDFEVLNDDSDLDLYTQLDFYQWLDDSLGESTL